MTLTITGKLTGNTYQIIGSDVQLWTLKGLMRDSLFVLKNEDDEESEEKEADPDRDYDRWKDEQVEMGLE